MQEFEDSPSTREIDHLGTYTYAWEQRKGYLKKIIIYRRRNGRIRTTLIVKCFFLNSS